MFLFNLRSLRCIRYDIPKDELTAEQIEKIRAEDKAIEDEESQGSNKKKK
jgi:hypothetical protein